MMAVKALALDLDGVILESVDIKTRAFRELFKGYPGQVERIVRFHLHNTGISRFEKFRIIYREYLQLPLDENELDRLGQAFSTLVFEEMLRCPFVPGAQEFLAKHSSRYPLFSVSATPQGELEEIIARRDLHAFFQGIYGYPPGKAAALRGILQHYGWQPREVIFVGDAANDYQATREAGIPFVGRVGKGQTNPFGKDLIVVEDLAEMDRRWPSLVKRLTSLAPCLAPP